MSRLQIAITVLISVVAGTQIESAPKKELESELRKAILNATTGAEAGKAFEKYFKSFSPREPEWLGPLRNDLNTSIALQAAWHQKG